MNKGEQLDAIMKDMDAAYAAIREADYRGQFDSPEYKALDAVYARLRAWNTAGVGMPSAGRSRRCARCGEEVTLRPSGWWLTAQNSMWCGWSKCHAPSGWGDLTSAERLAATSAAASEATSS